MLITWLLVAIIVAGILLVVLGANADNSLVSNVHDLGKTLVGPFKDLFSIEDPKVAIAVNWGLAALVYLIVGSLIARILRRVGVTSHPDRAHLRPATIWSAHDSRGPSHCAAVTGVAVALCAAPAQAAPVIVVDQGTGRAGGRPVRARTVGHRSRARSGPPAGPGTLCRAGPPGGGPRPGPGRTEGRHQRSPSTRATGGPTAAGAPRSGGCPGREDASSGTWSGRSSGWRSPGG